MMKMPRIIPILKNPYLEMFFEADQQIEEYSVQLKAATEGVKTYIK